MVVFLDDGRIYCTVGTGLMVAHEDKSHPAAASTTFRFIAAAAINFCEYKDIYSVFVYGNESI